MIDYPALARDTPHSSRVRNVVITVAGTIFLVLVANFSARSFLKNTPVNPADALVKRKWEILARQTAPVDWLILGDSTGNQNVNPAVVSETLGGGAVNLCTMANFLVLNDVWMLQEYLRRVGVPKNVLLVHAYDVWRRGLSEDLVAKVPLEWGFWNRLEPRQTLTRRGLVTAFLQRYVPLFTQSKSLATLVRMRADFSGPIFSIGPDGFMPVTRVVQEETARELAEHVAFVAGSSFSATAVNRQSLDEAVALADAQRFNLYVVNAPVHEELWRAPGFQAHFNDLQEMLRAHTSRSPRARVLLAPPVLAPGTALVGVDHLTVTGARTYTERMAKEIIASRHAPVLPAN